MNLNADGRTAPTVRTSVWRSALRGVLAVLAMCAGSALADNFPARTVRILTPFPAGSGPDAMLRVLSERLSGWWGQPVLVDNRPGGNGVIAIEAAKTQPADGYTLLQLDNAHMAMQPHLYKRLPYELARDFDPVATLFRTHFFVVVPMNSPWRNMTDLIAAARAQAGQLTYGSWYVGSPGHLGAAMLEARTGVQMTHVPFKDMGQLFAAVGNGDVGWAFGTAASSGPMYRARKVRYLAAAAPRRIAGFSEVPTVAEAGGPGDFEVKAWVALFAPKGVPAGVVARLNEDVGRALMDAGVREKLAAFTFEPFNTASKEIPALVEADLRRFGEVIKRMKLSLD